MPPALIFLGVIATLAALSGMVWLACRNAERIEDERRWSATSRKWTREDHAREKSRDQRADTEEAVTRRSIYLAEDVRVALNPDVIPRFHERSK